MRKLPGVGRKTANVVLGHAFGINEGIAVDTHVLRVTNRLGLAKGDDPLKVEAQLMALVPAGALDPHHRPHDLPRPQDLRRPAAALRRLPALRPLPLGRAGRPGRRRQAPGR